VTPQQLNLLAVVSLAACWGAFALTWLAGAIYNQSRAPAVERTRRWFVRSGWVVVGVGWVAVPKADWESLAVHLTPWVRLLGLAILLAATAFTLWARLALGTMWSGAPAVKQEHQLRTSGPYGVTRHPIYTGMLGMMLGSLLLAGGGRWVLPFPVFLVFLEIKIRVEERLMQAEFPGDYPRYRQRVPKLIPGLRLVSRRGVTGRVGRLAARFRQTGT
jgi:protein-S-isoprenylcysteine O-methyltransferase Ste14